MKILVTGGAGFIGSALVRRLVLADGHEVCTLDALTYAGSLDNLEAARSHPRHRFAQTDIADLEALRPAVLDFAPEAIVHLAAETHVDRSIDRPAAFIRTNLTGTANLLEVARELAGREGFRFIQVSTDEVYGSLGPEGRFSERSPYQPNSPYAASKAGADHLARAWFATYGLPAIITNCCNNYGPYQFPEKLIPLAILNAVRGAPVRLYGDGRQVRDWIHVEDHVDGLCRVLEAGQPGRIYNIGGSEEWANDQLVRLILRQVAAQTGRGEAELLGLIEQVADRPGHDRRYAIDPGRMAQELHWRAATPFEEGLAATVAWYLANQDWCEKTLALYDGRRLGQGGAA